MNDADKAFHAQWRYASGHPGGWRVCRKIHGQPLDEARGPSGRLRLFRTWQAAARVAAQLNEQEPKP